MFQTDRTIQRQLFAFTPRDLVSENSDVWLYVDLFDNLDVLDFDACYSSQGQEAKDPKLMLRTIFYALTHGITSGRRLHDACRNDNRFIVLSGDLRPDRRTFDRFIERHAAEIDKLFVQVIQVAQKMGLVKLGRVALDGSKFKAKADRSMRYDSMSRAITYIKEELEVLRKDLAEANAKESSDIEDVLETEIKSREVRLGKIQKAKDQIDKEFNEQVTKESKKAKRKPAAAKALNDADALSLGASAKFSFGYNAQAMVDSESQIIVGADLHQSSADFRALPSMLDQVKENCGSYPEKLFADAGYQSFENICEARARRVIPFIALGADFRQVKETANEQIWAGISDRTYYCMNGKKLKLASRGKDGILIFKLHSAFCGSCKFKERCQFFGKKNPSVFDDKQRSIMKTYTERARTVEFQDQYRFRKAIVEPVFGNIKNKGIRIQVTGRKKVKVWWKMACTAHNIEKIISKRKV